MTQTFSFDGYTVRPLSEKDRPFLEMQIKADEFHREWMTADFFLLTEPGEDAWALEDEAGMIVFYFKTSTAVRMFIQFPVIESRDDKERSRNGMLKGLAWISGMFRANRFREILFDTRRAELANFAKKRLGFQDAPGLLSFNLQPPTPKNVQESHSEAWEPFPQASQDTGEPPNVRRQ